MSKPDAHSKFLLVLAANENAGGAWISEDPRVQPTAGTAAWFQAIGDACRAKVLRRQRGAEVLDELSNEASKDAAADEAPASGVLATGTGWFTVASASRDSTRDIGR